MAINITMPALSPTMEEGTLSRWLKQPGDTIEAGDVIAEIETDKATMEVEAVDEGTLAKILVGEGTEGVKVNAVIGVLAEEGEDPEAVEAPSGGAANGAGNGASGQASQAQADEPEVETGGAAPGAPDRSDGDGKSAPQLSEGPLAEVGKGADRIKASPLARRIAAMEGVDLKALGAGSGPHGRIIRKDVEAAAKAAPGEPQTAAGAPSGSRELTVRPPDSLILPQTLDERVYDRGSYDLVSLDGMRKTVARRLTESFMQVPHFPLDVDIRLDALLAFRKKINANAPEGVKVSVNDMLIKAAALALMDEPDCNASYTDEGIAYHHHAHVSVAVAVDGGLITPVIRHAEQKGLSTIAAEMQDLAERARDRKLKPHEYQGGTFSLSNLGMFGVKSFASIINPPEGMILSVGAGEKRPVVGEDGELGVATVMSVTLTCDHRVIGGAEGARWLAAFRRYIETPEAMLL
ncbi:MAG: pyruvate dehydrogenase complex dihydrolipoamide acetyltransferase [Alphaproteobacteria bacterium]|jgi:pyruvate dehydrogenase E2 component (dihydrolipoamide acetyltransferase)|nr:pyruvate dehydrogenase complex dihydrolipoamide acetyltransferase [Alphaproteobacteria bacterium]